MGYIHKRIIALAGIILFVVMGATVALGGLGAGEVQTFGGLAMTSATTSFQGASPRMVWVSDTSGFLFDAYSTGSLGMSTTSNGGATWSSRVASIDSVNADVVSFGIWYDRWTEGDTGNIIHVVTTDTSVDDTYYTQVNALTGVRATTVLGTTQGATCTVGSSCYTAITKAKNGVLYMTATDGSDSWVVSCSGTCTTAGNWSERIQAYGSTPDLGDDIPLLFPVVGTNNVMLIYYDNSAGTLDWNTYSATSSMWMGSTTRTAASGYETEVTYEGERMAGTYSTSTGNIYISLADNVNDFTTQDHEIDVWKFATSTYTWTQLTNATTTTKGGITGQKIHYDPRAGALNLVYGWRSTIGTPSTNKLLMTVSADLGTSWTASTTEMQGQNESFNLIQVDPFSPSYFGVAYQYLVGANAGLIYYNKLSTLFSEVVGGVVTAVKRQSEIWFD
jgi:hypothetical protein